MRWLGSISYSLYLVHWPLIVFYRDRFGPGLDYQDCLILALFMLLSATVLNIGVEKRFRLASKSNLSTAGFRARSVGWGSLALLLVCVGTTTTLIASQGWPQRLPADAQVLASKNPRFGARQNRDYVRKHCLPEGALFCGLNPAGDADFLVLGDSRGPDLYTALQTAYPEATVALSYGMGCPPVFDKQVGWSPFMPTCPEYNQQRLSHALAPGKAVVVLAMDFNVLRAPHIFNTATRIQATGRRVSVLGECRFLDGKSPQEIIVEAHWRGDNRVQHYLVEEPFGLDAQWASRFNDAGITYISCADFYWQGGPRLYTSDKQRLLSLDGKHFTTAGAREFGVSLADRYPQLGTQQ